MSHHIQIGDFRIERRIGAGGMGIVYLATQMSLNRTVALKVLGQSLQRPVDIARFKREARAVAKLSHPNIASVHFVGQDDEVCYMAMEFIDGLSLHDCIDRLSHIEEPDSSIDKVINATGSTAGSVRFDLPAVDEVTVELSKSDADLATQPADPYRSPQADKVIFSDKHLRRVAEIVRDVARALAHAHDNGVIHRDLKPGNLMLDRSGVIHVIDFGLATYFDDASLTQTGALVGTPMYMSPEQVTGRIDLDGRTDIYSLGIVFYELLVLHRAISSTTREGVLRSIVAKPLKPVSRLNSQVPESLQSIVHKATEKDADNRYQNANEFADDIDRYLEGVGVHARPYKYRIDESVIRDRRPLTVFLASAALAIDSSQRLLRLPWQVWELVRFFGFVLSFYTSSGPSNDAGSFEVIESMDYLVWSATNTVLCVSGFFVAWLLMTGRRFAMKAFLLFATITALLHMVSLLNMMDALPWDQVGSDFQSQLYTGVVITWLILILAVVVAVKDRQWFRFASSVRREEAAEA